MQFNRRTTFHCISRWSDYIVILNANDYKNKQMRIDTNCRFDVSFSSVFFSKWFLHSFFIHIQMWVRHHLYLSYPYANNYKHSFSFPSSLTNLCFYSSLKFLTKKKKKIPRLNHLNRRKEQKTNSKCCLMCLNIYSFHLFQESAMCYE